MIFTNCVYFLGSEDSNGPALSNNSVNNVINLNSLNNNNNDNSKNNNDILLLNSLNQNNGNSYLLDTKFPSSPLDST